MYNNQLAHYGVKGMKWGVHRYQNADGSLTSAGKKKISKQYRKASDKVVKDLNKNRSNMYVKSYNKTADYMNSGGIDKFNAAQRKKYGDKYAERDGYVEDYQKLFDKELTRNMNKTLDEFYKTNHNYQKSKELVDKHSMTSWDELAKNNEAIVEDVRHAVEKDL